MCFVESLTREIDVLIKGRVKCLRWKIEERNEIGTQSTLKSEHANMLRYSINGNNKEPTNGTRKMVTPLASPNVN